MGEQAPKAPTSPRPHGRAGAKGADQPRPHGRAGAKGADQPRPHGRAGAKGADQPRPHGRAGAKGADQPRLHGRAGAKGADQPPEAIMKLSEALHKAMNEQIAREFTAHFLYRAIAFDLYDKGYYGFSEWMENHAREEYGHAEKIIGYLKEKTAKVSLGKINLTDKNWEDPRSAVEAALAHEEWLTAEIHKLHDLASKENDKTSILLLDWFVEEQKEEEMIVNELLKRMRISDFSPIGIMLVDSELRAGATRARKCSRKSGSLMAGAVNPCFCARGNNQL